MEEYIKNSLDYFTRRLGYLREDLKRVHPGSKAQARVLREIKTAEIDVGLWQGRLTEIRNEARS